MEEKMLILKMLQEGKITTDEAVKLLEALEKGGSGTPSSGSKINEIKDYAGYIVGKIINIDYQKKQYKILVFLC